MQAARPRERPRRSTTRTRDVQGARLKTVAGLGNSQSCDPRTRHVSIAAEGGVLKGQAPPEILFMEFRSTAISHCKKLESEPRSFDRRNRF
jgi:hypothetical protein